MIYLIDQYLVNLRQLVDLPHQLIDVPFFGC